jgi:hypothetical protein
MKETLAKNPDVLFLDTTYRVNIENFCLQAFVVMDKDGFGQPVCLVFLRNEKEPTLRPVFGKFKQENTVSGNLENMFHSSYCYLG